MVALQVEPVQWSALRQRKVLNAALASPITTEMIRAADFAVANGYSGSLSRCVHNTILLANQAPIVSEQGSLRSLGCRHGTRSSGKALTIAGLHGQRPILAVGAAAGPQQGTMSPRQPQLRSSQRTVRWLALAPLT